MPIDFTQLHAPASAPVKPTPGVSAAASFLSTLSLRVGQAVPAQVAEVRALTAQERALIQSLAAPQSNARSGQETPRTLNSALLNPPALKLVTVKMEAGPLALLSALPLVRGDEVLVQRVSAQKLTIVSENGKPLPPGEGHKRPEADLRPSRPAFNQTLREILPRLNAPSLEQQSHSLQQLIRLLPDGALTKTLTESLRALDRHTLAADKLHNLPNSALAGLTKQLIANSGSFWESQLSKQAASPQALPQALLTTDRKAILLGLIQVTLSALQGQSPSAAANSTPDTDAIAQIVKNFTGAHIRQAGPAIATPADTTQAAGTGKPELLDIRHLAPSLTQALLSGATISPQSGEAGSLQTQLLLLIHQLSLNSLAKIRAQQLGIEPKNSRGPDSPANPHHFSVDLPVRWGEQVEHARIRFEEEAASAPSESSSTARAWLVKLHINTAAIGDLYIHLRYFQDRINLNLWGQNEEILSEAKTKLNAVREAMQAAGLEISEVKYFQGKPEGKSNYISYHLVDIKT